MAHQRSVRGGRSWFGKAEAKTAGRVSRRQVDREEIRRSLLDRLLRIREPEPDTSYHPWDEGW